MEGRDHYDQLIRIADGRTTVEEERADTAERVAKSRADLPIRSGEDDPETSAEAMKAKFADDEEDVEPDIETSDIEETDQTKTRAEVAKLVRAWVKASPEAKRQFIRERWDEIARARKQLDANGAAHEDRSTESDTL